ncbi:hypothetical protein ACQEVB_24165 [Pseudonocardia sp. CA-107938]|uniref:hypothetical protein n=1 Tax=Pseudonocardia sp. CA-107938 TaxID=3240021 RepID=UPI003D8BE9C5
MGIRLLTGFAAVELGSLLVLLVNLAMAHVPAVAALFGPLHGTAYVAAIVGAALRAGTWSLPTLLSVVPGVGATLAVTVLRRRGPA